MVLNLIQYLTVQQDYWWFCALLLWGVACATFFAGKEIRTDPVNRVSVLVIMVSGILITVIEMASHVVPRSRPDEEFVVRDLSLFTLQCIQAVAPAAALFSSRRRRTVPLTVLLGGALLTGLLRRFAPLSVDLFAHLVAIAIGIVIVRRGHDLRSGASRAVLLANLGFLFSTTGILSELFHQQRRFVELSALAVPSAGMQLALAGVWTHQHLPNGVSGYLRSLGISSRRGSIGLAVGLALWLAAGFVMAGATARSARTGFENSLLARARVCSKLMRPEGIDAILQPAFRVERLQTVPQPNGRQTHVGRSAYLPAAARRTRHDLVQAQDNNPDIYWAFFMTLRDGWVVIPAVAENLPAEKDVVGIVRPVGANDLVDWAEKRAYVEGPLLTDYDEIVRVAAPLTTPTGAMRGWLVFEVGAAVWARVQAVARFQALALVGAGSGLLLLLLVLRHRTAAREGADRKAAAAAAADHAKSVFLAKVSHELRTPVQSMLGYAELLRDYAESPQRTRWLQALNGQSRLLLRLVNDLIDLSALQSGAFRLVTEPGRVGDLIKQTVDALEPAAQGKGLSLVMEFSAPPPPWLQLDDTRLRQIAFNLVGNAIKFTACGSVSVRLDATPTADGTVQVTLVVKDTGPGISPENQVRLFRPFQRLDRDTGQEGAGLGLALSRALCEKMGGGLSVESDGLNGSTFTATWRLLPCESPPLAEPPPLTCSLAGTRVLVVDDNPMVADYYLWVLRSAGAWCDYTATGLEAITLSTSHDYAVIVMDLSMPGIDGFATTRLIRANGKPSRIIGVSAHVQAEDRDRAADVGMEALLLKPVSSRELLSIIARTTPFESLAPADDLALIRRLRLQFRQELPGLRLALAAANADGDFARVRERVHYLKNCADVARHAELSALCARVEALPSPDVADFKPALQELLAFLEHLLSHDHSPPFWPTPEN